MWKWKQPSQQNAKIASNNMNGVVFVLGWSGAETVSDLVVMATVRYVPQCENYAGLQSSSGRIPALVPS